MARIRTRSVAGNQASEKVAVAERQRRRQPVNDETDELDDEDDEGLTPRKDRPTPSAREAREREGGLIDRIPVVRTIVAYFRGVASEMQKVTWPSREETTRLTAVVLGVTIAFAIGLGILDAFLSWWFRQAFSTDTVNLFLIVAAVAATVIGAGYFALRNRI